MLGFKFPKEYRILLAEHMIITETAAIQSLAEGSPEATINARTTSILSQLELTKEDLGHVVQTFMGWR